eukprot:Hpha_TRINITY_DN15572_c0_g2::TRINITY_DN15572_c0_g2_i1::g.106439::m.106439
MFSLFFAFPCFLPTTTLTLGYCLLLGLLRGAATPGPTLVVLEVLRGDEAGVVVLAVGGRVGRGLVRGLGAGGLHAGGGLGASAAGLVAAGDVVQTGAQPDQHDHQEERLDVERRGGVQDGHGRVVGLQRGARRGLELVGLTHPDVHHETVVAGVDLLGRGELVQESPGLTAVDSAVVQGAGQVLDDVARGAGGGDAGLHELNDVRHRLLRVLEPDQSVDLLTSGQPGLARSVGGVADEVGAKAHTLQPTPLLLLPGVLVLARVGSLLVLRPRAVGPQRHNGDQQKSNLELGHLNYSPLERSGAGEFPNKVQK